MIGRLFAPTVLLAAILAGIHLRAAVTDAPEPENRPDRITATGNVVIRPEFDADAIAGVADQALAVQIADRRHGYSWRPQWIDRMVHGVRLPGFALSRDRSVLAVIETTGAPGEANGSRIVFLSTMSWKPIRICAFYRLLLTQICFLDHHCELMAAIMQRQQAREQKSDALVLIDMTTGNVVSRLPLPGTGKTALLACGKFLVIKTASLPDAVIYEVGPDLTLLPREKVRVGVGVRQLAEGENGKTALLAGSGRIISCDLSSGEIIDELTVKDQTEPVAVLQAGQADRIAVALNNNRAFLYIDKMRFELGTQAGGGLRFAAADAIIFTMDRSGHLVTPWSLDGKICGRKIKPAAMPPRTMGYMVFWAPLASNRLVFCSNFGDIIELHRVKRNWVKKTPISALR